MDQLLRLMEHHGLGLVFLNIFVQQLGVPVPATPLLVMAGVMTMRGTMSFPLILITATVAALLANLVWYLAGRRYGHRVLGAMCRLSLSPDSCVRKTESTFHRWGASTLLVAKFIPGLSTVAPPLSGATRIPLAKFAFFEIMGSLLWIGSVVLAGRVFHNMISEVLILLSNIGSWAIALIGPALLALIALKWWERQRFLKMLRTARITVEELHSLMQRGLAPLILDVRTEPVIPPLRIPGAIVFDVISQQLTSEQYRKDQDIIVYCTCPNEASAASIARRLMEQGFLRVRPLQGGLDAWKNAGHPIE